MIDMDMIRSARWDELYLFLFHGEPPLILLLLAVNTLFFVLFVVRRATQRHQMRPSTVYFVQAVMLVANAAVLFSDDAIRYAMMLKNVF